MTLASRIEHEYGLPVRFEPASSNCPLGLLALRPRWTSWINTVNKGHMAEDHDGDAVFLTCLHGHRPVGGLPWRLK